MWDRMYVAVPLVVYAAGPIAWWVYRRRPGASALSLVDRLVAVVLTLLWWSRVIAIYHDPALADSAWRLFGLLYVVLATLWLVDRRLVWCRIRDNPFFYLFLVRMEIAKAEIAIPWWRRGDEIWLARRVADTWECTPDREPVGSWTRIAEEPEARYFGG